MFETGVGVCVGGQRGDADKMTKEQESKQECGERLLETHQHSIPLLIFITELGKKSHKYRKY